MPNVHPTEYRYLTCIALSIITMAKHANQEAGHSDNHGGKSGRGIVELMSWVQGHRRATEGGAKAVITKELLSDHEAVESLQGLWCMT